MFDLADSPWRIYEKATAAEPCWKSIETLLYLDPSVAADPKIAQLLHETRYGPEPKPAVDAGYAMAQGGYRWLDHSKPEAVKERKIRFGAALQLLAGKAKELSGSKRAKYAVNEPDVRRLWDAVAHDLSGKLNDDSLPETARLQMRLKDERENLIDWLEREGNAMNPLLGKLLREILAAR